MNLTEEALSRATTLGGKDALNCIAELDPTAPEQARALKEKDRKKLPLWGVPVLIKDNIDVKGLHTTAGSLALVDNLATTDAPVIRNLRRNGAVILGKTNMTEFANYTTQNMPGGYSSRGGQVLHAVDPKLDVAGSSSGSAVAVAAGIVPMAVGTDTSHSVTGCAKYNGICGLKPPVGVLSTEGIIPIAKAFDSAGAMARNLTDALKLYSAMRDEPLPALEAEKLPGLRIAMDVANAHVFSPEERKFTKWLLKTLEAQGAVIGKVRRAPIPQMGTIMQYEFGPLLEKYLAGSNASLKTLKEIVEYYEAHPDTMMKYGDTCLRAALDETPGGLEGEPYLKAMKYREKATVRLLAAIKDYDAVLMAGPTNAMHFCGLPTLTLAAKAKLSNGVHHTAILYGADEYRLYRAALAIEKVMQQSPADGI